MKKRFFISLAFAGLLAFASCATEKNITLDDAVLYTPCNLNSSSEYEKNSDNFITATNKLNTFASNITASVLNLDYSENIAISPLSIYMALAMTQAVTSGDTKQEILDVLGMNEDEVQNYTKSLYNYSQKEKYNYDGTLVLKEVLNNSIWLDNNIEYKDEALINLSTNYAAGSHKVDFDGDNALANKLISEYIKEKTEGLISQDLNLSEDTVFSLINTLYFEDTWNLSCKNLDKTSNKRSFINSDGSSTYDYFLMSNYCHGKSLLKDNYTAFHAFTEGDYEITFILPNDNYTVEDAFNNGAIEYVTSTDFNNDIKKSYEDENYYYMTRCVFPEFEASYNGNIMNSLQELGLNKMFKYNADFSPITDEKAHVESVIHSTKFKASEKGLKGAAITVVSTYYTAAQQEKTPIYYDFNINKSFGFVVTDKNNVPVFTGKVDNI